LFREESPAPSNVKFVLFECARSADPPISHGIFFASAFSAFPRNPRRHAFASAGNVGKSLSQPLGSFHAPSNQVAQRNPETVSCSFDFFDIAVKSAPRFPMPFLNWS